MTAERRNEPTEQGGDPPCWAHLFEHDAAEPEPVCDDVLAELVRGLADAVLIANTEGRIVFWNAAAERLFGWSADEVVGQSMEVIIPERLRDRHWEGWRRVVATGETKYGTSLLEVPAARRDGRQLSIAFTVSLLTGPDDAVAAVAAVLRDDTARWQQRREQRDEIARLRAELEAATGAAGPT
jgi:PAS domain S-box-containing protein